MRGRHNVRGAHEGAAQANDWGGEAVSFSLIPGTLRSRLAVAAAGSILVAVALYALATVLVVDHQLRSSLDQALRQRAQEVAQLAVSAPAVLTYPGGLESPVSGRQIAVEVIDSRGRILARSLTLGARLIPQDRLALEARVAGATGFEDIRIDRRPYRIYAAPIAEAGGPAAGGAVLVASDTTDISGTVHHLGLVLALIGAGIALLAALLAAVLTRRGLHPLRRLAGAAAEIERTADPARRLPEPDVADEIGQLTGVLNRMLASLGRARESERRFLADASHELRTPVTSLRGNVEYASRHGADAEVLADLERDADRLTRLVDDLLALERAGAPAQEPGPLALDQVVEHLVAEEQRRGAPVRVAALEPAQVLGDEEALERMVRNLIENALVHGPEGGQVTVELTRRGERALLTVRDQGPGPDGAHVERIFERFWRGPEASQRPGSGLGLSIVSAIAERHGGRVSVDGAAFTVELAALGEVRPNSDAGGGAR